MFFRSRTEFWQVMCKALNSVPDITSRQTMFFPLLHTPLLFTRHPLTRGLYYALQLARNSSHPVLQLTSTVPLHGTKLVACVGVPIRRFRHLIIPTLRLPWSPYLMPTIFLFTGEQEILRCMLSSTCTMTVNSIAYRAPQDVCFLTCSSVSYFVTLEILRPLFPLVGTHSSWV